MLKWSSTPTKHSTCNKASTRNASTSRFNFTPATVSRLALTLHQLIRQHELKLPNDPKLRDELANVRLIQPSPGTYRLDHDAGRHDDRAIALGIAAHHLLHTEQPPRMRILV